MPALLAMLGGLGVAGAAEQVAVSGVQSGFGILRARGAECFAIAPRHVVEGSARLRVTTVNGVTAPARIEREFETADLAILRLEPGLACPQQWDVATDLQRRLRPGQRGVVTSTGPGGAVESRYVLIDRWDDDTIEFRPDSARDAMRAGLSGSLLLLEGQPAGMVIEVDTRERRGRAYRMDLVAHTVARFFDRDPPAVGGSGGHPWDGLWLAMFTPGLGQPVQVTFRIRVRGQASAELTAYRPRDPYTCGLVGPSAACLPAGESAENRYGDIRVREARVSATELSIAYTELRQPSLLDPGLAPWTDPGLAPWLGPGAGPIPGLTPAPAPAAPYLVNLRLQARLGPPSPLGARTAPAMLIEHDPAWRPLPGSSYLFQLARVGE